ncbi:DUF3616 domain-containing protein [Gordonia zhaorongruii]|uniref:DUF3616 domain-containing protein n=1 Tax=Gordonia zhaorongruii TaxID=2597659 RepID=UPI001048EFED|nr:DUF3616 domain-containing protein [Gordonia zhaorongruii]
MASPRTARLQFSERARKKEINTNLSAIRTDGDDTLWVGGDEGAVIHRLTRKPGRTVVYGDEQVYALADLVPMPSDDADEEADLEGFARDGHYLWAVGSHSRKRSRIKEQHSTEKAFERLAKVKSEENRHVLLRIPVTDEDGVSELREHVELDGRTEHAAVLGVGSKSLTELLREDEHLAPFLSIPSKDNGIDIEGIAAFGDRVFVGLRGPVLRGWATVIELRLTPSKKHPERLKARRLDDGSRYRKHLLDLGGLGVRDLCSDGRDILVLSGPTMDLDGPVRVHRWKGAPDAEASQLVRAPDLETVLDLPYGEGDDHAEGIALLNDPDPRELLVVYDSPAPRRINPQRGMLADRFPLSD